MSLVWNKHSYFSEIQSLKNRNLFFFSYISPYHLLVGKMAVMGTVHYDGYFENQLLARLMYTFGNIECFKMKKMLLHCR